MKSALSPTYKAIMTAHPVWTKTSACFLNNSEICFVSNNFLLIFLYIYEKCALISNIRSSPRHCCWWGGSQGRQARLWDHIKLRNGPLPGCHATGERNWSRERREQARISSLGPSKVALMGPYCMFCGNPVCSTQNHRNSLELEATIEVI